MIYLENHCRGKTGLNNHVLPFTLGIAMSNFLDRDFYFDYELPTITLPEVDATGQLKRELEHVMNAERSLVSDLLAIPNRRVFEIDRNAARMLRIDDPMLTFMTTADQRERFGSTMIWNFFSLGREALVKEDLAQYDLLEFGPNCIINATFYYFLEREAKRRLLESIRIRYADDLEKLAAKIVSSAGPFNAIHLRLGDFRSVYGPDGFKVDAERFGKFLQTIFTDRDVTVFIATDEFQEKNLFAKMLDGFDYRFIDEIILGEFFDEFRTLRFSDFNVLSVLTQLICAAGDHFAGTCRSTFTSVIHRIRQERYGKADFNLFPDERVNRHLDAAFNVVPDGQGFFEWNRFTAFAEHYEYPAWMREWNYDLTAV